MAVFYTGERLRQLIYGEIEACGKSGLVQIFRTSKVTAKPPVEEYCAVV